MQLADFDFDLPADRIAQQPASPREAARLLFVPPEPASFGDHLIRDLPSLLRPNDLLVFNDTKVIPAQLYGYRDAIRVGVTLIEQINPLQWQALAKPGRKLRVGDTIRFADDLKAKVVEKSDDGSVTLRFDGPADDFHSRLEMHGQMPLPPYIHRDEKRDTDTHDYQTIFATHAGAVAAPTAGLHFTPRLMEAFRKRGIECCTVTLHVGAGTFLPVKVDTISEHRMHTERVIISSEAASSINRAKAAGRRIIAVGTTSLRSLEAAATVNSTIQPSAFSTEIFITPGYRFRVVDGLITNFHLPKSTLFMLVSAFSGLDRMQAAYRHAIETQYRFFSYGDAMLLERA